MDIIRNAIRLVPDFPKQGILFKDITPILQNEEVGHFIVDEFVRQFSGKKIDAIAGIESRGFLFGYALALKMKIPFIPIRKSGKLPWKTVGIDYALEYGTARIEMHEDAVKPGMQVMIHDDLLATGGTASAAAQLITGQNAHVAAFSFVVELDFLNGRDVLQKYSTEIVSLVRD
ncbi:MAG TPA: adenine phosphoribosyltransferase [Bacteroidia bacterium]|nr:adenine phosphoribosyltransferase [Bacteroidia bacterium]